MKRTRILIAVACGLVAAVVSAYYVSTADQRAFAVARQRNTIAAYQSFVRAFPKSRLVRSAQDGIVPLAFEEARSANTIEGYDSFVRAYPKSAQAADAKQRLKELRAEEHQRKAETFESQHRWRDAAREWNAVVLELPENQEAMKRACLDTARAHTSVQVSQLAVSYSPSAGAKVTGIVANGTGKPVSNLHFKWRIQDLGQEKRVDRASLMDFTDPNPGQGTATVLELSEQEQQLVIWLNRVASQLEGATTFQGIPVERIMASVLDFDILSGGELKPDEVRPFAAVTRPNVRVTDGASLADTLERTLDLCSVWWGAAAKRRSGRSAADYSIGSGF